MTGILDTKRIERKFKILKTKKENTDIELRSVLKSEKEINKRCIRRVVLNQERKTINTMKRRKKKQIKGLLNRFEI